MSSDTQADPNRKLEVKVKKPTAYQRKTDPARHVRFETAPSDL